MRRIATPLIPAYSFDNIVSVRLDKEDSDTSVNGVVLIERNSGLDTSNSFVIIMLLMSDGSEIASAQDVTTPSGMGDSGILRKFTA